MLVRFREAGEDDGWVSGSNLSRKGGTEGREKEESRETTGAWGIIFSS